MAFIRICSIVPFFPAAGSLALVVGLKKKKPFMLHFSNHYLTNEVAHEIMVLITQATSRGSGASAQSC